MIRFVVGQFKHSVKMSLSKFIREIGLTLYCRGSFFSKDCAYLQPNSRHRIINYLDGERPQVNDKASLSPNCSLHGAVYVGKYSKIWYGAVLRAQQGIIRVGQNCQISDNCIIQNSRLKVPEVPDSVNIANRVYIGSYTFVGSAVLDDDVFIGPKCVVNDGCILERGVILAPGSVLPNGSLCMANTYWAGAPAQYVKDVHKEQRQKLLQAGSRS